MRQVVRTMFPTLGPALLYAMGEDVFLSPSLPPSQTPEAGESCSVNPRVMCHYLRIPGNTGTRSGRVRDIVYLPQKLL